MFRSIRPPSSLGATRPPRGMATIRRSTQRYKSAKGRYSARWRRGRLAQPVALWEGATGLQRGCRNRPVSRRLSASGGGVAGGTAGKRLPSVALREADLLGFDQGAKARRMRLCH